ncbi:ribosome-inactivating family protein [Streptomyces sp. NPDC017413]|uniref:ribosome-inactivating family protein n=1 Tax=unclassified Streptomyces TaxID=2593676 RepID=UPI00379AC96D
MTEHPALHRRTLLSAGLATALVAPVLTAAPARAQPQPVPTVRILEWDITGLNSGNPTSQNVATQYHQMTARLFYSIGREIPDTGGAVRVTDATRSQLIELRVIDRNNLTSRHRLTLYLWSDNLYLIGITAQGLHYAFLDMVDSGDAALATAALQAHYGGPVAPFARLAFGGRYTGNGMLDPNNNRAAFTFGIFPLAQAINTLSALRQTNNVQIVRDSFVRIIAATAEAVRFGWVRNRIEAILRAGFQQDEHGQQTTLGGFGVDLERNWGAISQWAGDSHNGDNPPPYSVDGMSPYLHIPHLLNGNGHRRMQHLMALSSRW